MAGIDLSSSDAVRGLASLLETDPQHIDNHNGHIATISPVNNTYTSPTSFTTSAATATATTTEGGVSVHRACESCMANASKLRTLM